MMTVAKLQAWLTRKGYELILKNNVDDWVTLPPWKKVVNVNKNVKIEELTCTLLHECGHIMIYDTRKRNRKKRVYGGTFTEWNKDRGRFKKRTTNAIIAEIEEEIGAWDMGLELAKRLKIRINKTLYDKSRARALMTYFRSAAKKR